MANAEIVDKVIIVARDQLEVKGEITAESHYVNDLDADSLDMAEMVMALEERFGVEIGDEKAETMTTIGKTAEVIEEILKAKA